MPRILKNSAGRMQQTLPLLHQLHLIDQLHLIEAGPVFAGQVDFARGGVEGDAVEHVGVGSS